MAASLLERHEELRLLGDAVDRARRGHGSTVLVFGEAGIGKTSLIRAFLSGHGERVRVLSGACEDLLTPRALGPLRDAARSAAGPLAEAFAPDADPDQVFAAVSAELGRAPYPCVLVVEDAQWADSATLDVLRYVGRRIADLHAVLMVSYRDDDLGRDHPLRGVLGGLGGPTAVRLRLARLTQDAVAELAATTAADPAEVYQLTGGNPFFVSEALASCGDGVPPTVVDAVLGRVLKLSVPVQRALDLLAVAPAGMDLSLLRALVPDPDRIAEAERAGVIEVRPDGVAFCHELARRAVVESMPRSLRLALNAAVLEALLASPDPDPFRVFHHALQAGDDAAVVAHGPGVAREAARAGAHVQAASAYGAVLARGGLVPIEQRAALGEAYSWALHNSNQLQAAADVAALAVEQWEAVGTMRGSSARWSRCRDTSG